MLLKTGKRLSLALRERMAPPPHFSLRRLHTQSASSTWITLRDAAVVKPFVSRMPTAQQQAVEHFKPTRTTTPTDPLS